MSRTDAAIALALILALPPATVVAEAPMVAPIPGDPRDQLHPRIAFDGRGIYLVVWQQGRDYYQQQGADVLGMLLDSSGRALDDQPLRIAAAEGSQEHPQVVFAGGAFIVIWQDSRNGRDWDVYTARIGPHGDLIDPPGGVALAAATRNQAMPTLASDGSTALAVWQQAAGDGFYRLHAASIPPSGSPGEAWPLRYERADATTWFRYSPGWGYSNLPLNVAARDDHTLRGGMLSLAYADDTWFLAWKDESNWAPGGTGAHTGRFARFRLDDGGTPLVLDMARSPIALSAVAGDLAAGRELLLYAAAERPGRSGRIGAGALLGADSAEPLPNPDPDTGPRGSRWDAERTVLLFGGSPAITGRVAATYVNDRFVTVAAGAAGRRDATPARRLYLGQLAPDGSRPTGDAQATVVYQGRRRPANPDVAAGRNGLLVVFEEEDEHGHSRIRSLPLRDP